MLSIFYFILQVNTLIRKCFAKAFIGVVISHFNCCLYIRSNVLPLANLTTFLMPSMIRCFVYGRFFDRIPWGWRCLFRRQSIECYQGIWESSELHSHAWISNLKNLTTLNRHTEKEGNKQFSRWKKGVKQCDWHKDFGILNENETQLNPMLNTTYPFRVFCQSRDNRYTQSERFIGTLMISDGAWKEHYGRFVTFRWVMLLRITLD